MAFLRAGLYAIADAGLLPEQRWQPAVAEALAGGAVLLQVRDKLGPAAARRARVEALLPLCRAHGVPLLVNDDLDLALACAADGVHLGQGDGSLNEARQRLGPQRLLGVTCHASLDLAAAAVAAGADYLAFGALFASPTKPAAPACPLTVLGEAARRWPVPVCGIGGLTIDNAPQAIAAGASLLAVVSGLFATPDIRATAAHLAGLFPSSPEPVRSLTA